MFADSDYIDFRHQVRDFCEHEIAPLAEAADETQQFSPAAIMQVMRGSPVDVPCDSHANVAQVVETHHADDTVVVATGGNHGTKLGYVLGYYHHRPEDKLRIVKELAKDLGYNLSKRRSDARRKPD